MNEIMKALAVTAEVCGTEFSDPAAKAIVTRLKAYPIESVLKAMDKCQVEVTSRLTLAAIISRIDDGRPTADEAWSNALQANNERATVVWTTETEKAYWAAANLFESGDNVGARMAFRDVYDREVSDARQQNIPVRWSVTLGHDKELREKALLMAAELNRISHDRVKALLPYIDKHTDNESVKMLAETIKRSV